MLRKVINFTDYTGKPCSQECYFDLAADECVDLNLQFEKDGGLIGHLKKLLEDKIDGEMPKKPMVDFVKLLIENSYGIRPKDDPTLFLKEDENGNRYAKKFMQSLAYKTYIWGLLSGEEPLDEFAKNVLPDVSDEALAEGQKQAEEMGFVAPEVKA